MTARFIGSSLLALTIAVAFSGMSPKYGRLHADASCWAGFGVSVYQNGSYIGPSSSNGVDLSEPDLESCYDAIRSAYLDEASADCAAAGSPSGSVAVVLWWGQYGSLDLTDGQGDDNEEDISCV